MRIIAIATQEELDALPAYFDEYTRIEIRSAERIVLNGARGNSSVVARGNSSVEAWENSSVEARENSSVEAFEFSMIAVLSAAVVIKKLHDWAMASFRGVAAEVRSRHQTATVVETPAEMTYTREMFFDRCESDDEESVILYKSVNPKTGCDFQTGMIKYEGIVECPDWDGDHGRECGGGLHLSPTPGTALSYHRGKILRCRVKRDDLVIYSKNITKVRCRRVEVLEAL